MTETADRSTHPAQDGGCCVKLHKVDDHGNKRMEWHPFDGQTVSETGSTPLLGSRARRRVQRRFKVVHCLVVQPEQVIVTVADDALLVDHDHRALGPEPR